MKKLSTCIFIFLLLATGSQTTLQSQPLLSLGEAFEIALDNDLNIRQLRQRTQIATLNNTKGNAGMLPSVGLDGTARYGISNSKISFASGDDQTRNGATSFSGNIGISADAPIYHGGQGKYLLQQFELLITEANTEERKAIHELQYNLFLAYNDIIFQEKLLRISLENVAYLESLKLLAEKSMELGRGTRLEIIQTTADLNREQSNILAIELELELAKSRLNDLLERDAYTDFSVDTSAIGHREWKLPELLNEAQNNSFDLRLAAQDISYLELQQKIARAQQSPYLAAFGGLDFSYSRSGAGFVQSSRSYGPHIGLTFSLPIYEGGQLSRANELAELNTLIARTFHQNISSSLKQSLQQQFQRYETARARLALEAQNVALLEENFRLAEQMYRGGRINFYDFRQTRQQLILNQIARLRLDYELLKHEIELANLAGINLISGQ